MKFSFLHALQFGIARLGLATVRPKQADTIAISAQEAAQLADLLAPKQQPAVRETLTERKLQAVDRLVAEMEHTPRQRERDATRDVSMLLSQLSLAASFHEPLAIAPPASVTAQPAEKVRAIAIGFPVLQQNRLQQAFSSISGAQLDFVTLDSLADRKPEIYCADLLVINIASVDVTKRQGQQFLELLQAGRPVLLTGSRTALKALNILNNYSKTWDFLPVPWNPDELMWRMRRFIEREPAALTTSLKRRTPTRAGAGQSVPVSRAS